LCIYKIDAQELLTLENAVKTALENNYDIKIASNVLKIDQTNVAAGNAGMLPKVAATITDTNGLQNVSQTKSDGTTTKLDNAKSSNLNYGIGLDWTIFDGFKMFAKLDQLKELQKLGEAQLKATILSKISTVTSTYFDLVQQQQQLQALDTAIVISKQRLILAQNRFSIGKASKLEVLNAQVDLNSDTTTLIKTKELIYKYKTAFNQILARDLKTDFKVVEKINVDDKLLLPKLTELAQKQNPQLEAQIINQRVSELQLKQIKAARYPTIKVNSGYNFADSKASIGFTTQSSARGLNYGFSAAMNIFDGFAQNRNEKIAQIEIQNSKLAIEQQNIALKSQLETAYQTYITNLELIGLEQKMKLLQSKI